MRARWGVLLAVLTSTACPECGGEQGRLAETTRLLSSSTEELDFGTLYVGNEAQKIARVRNVGDGNVTISGISVDGSGDFRVGNPSRMVLATGEASEMVVTFGPNDEGERIATLKIANDSRNEPELRIIVRGIGDGTPTCDDENDCTEDSFDQLLGMCVHLPNDRACDDGSECTSDDRCVVGECRGLATVCVDDNPCSRDLCDPRTGCYFAQDTSHCDDGNPCTAHGCSLERNGCYQVRLDDGTGCAPAGANPCMAYQCLAGTCVATPLAELTPCSDGDICTLGDLCVGGTCLGVRAPEAPAVHSEVRTYGGRYATLFPLREDRVLFFDADARDEQGVITTLVTTTDVNPDGRFEVVRRTSLQLPGIIAMARIDDDHIAAAADDASGHVVLVLEVRPNGEVALAASVPVPMFALWVSSQPGDMVVVDGVLFACVGNGFAKIDLNDLGDVQANHHTTTTECIDLAYDPLRQRLYVVGFGVETFDLSDPFNPSWGAYARTDRSFMEVEVSSSHLVMNGPFGVEILSPDDFSTLNTLFSTAMRIYQTDHGLLTLSPVAEVWDLTDPVTALVRSSHPAGYGDVVLNIHALAPSDDRGFFRLVATPELRWEEVTGKELGSIEDLVWHSAELSTTSRSAVHRIEIADPDNPSIAAGSTFTTPAVAVALRGLGVSPIHPIPSDPWFGDIPTLRSGVVIDASDPDALATVASVIVENNVPVASDGRHWFTMTATAQNLVLSTYDSFAMTSALDQSLSPISTLALDPQWVPLQGMSLALQENGARLVAAVGYFPSTSLYVFDVEDVAHPALLAVVPDAPDSRSLAVHDDKVLAVGFDDNVALKLIAYRIEDGSAVATDEFPLSSDWRILLFDGEHVLAADNHTLHFLTLIDGQLNAEGEMPLPRHALSARIVGTVLAIATTTSVTFVRPSCPPP